MKYFDKKNRRLIEISQKADNEYWDDLWNSSAHKDIMKDSQNKMVLDITKKFLPNINNIRILEGGCGRGQLVYAFHQKGYQSYGVDFAEQTIKKIQSLFPELNVSYGDVRNLDFPADYFDGYWSRGVIEHFWDGYDSIAKEMKRVIKPNGLLFLTFPNFSRLRRFKSFFGAYQIFHDQKTEPENFYQFFLDSNDVEKHFLQHGFQLIKKKPYNAIWGLREESKVFDCFYRKIEKRQDIFSKGLRFSCRLILPQSFFGHSIVMIFKKK